MRVPVPERFAIHKLIASTLRSGRDAKSLEDREQASVLIAALAELHPGALASAVREAPRGTRRSLSHAVGLIRRKLETDHPRAVEELDEVIRLR